MQSLYVDCGIGEDIIYKQILPCVYMMRKIQTGMKREVFVV